MGVAELVLDCLGSKDAISSLLQDGRGLELSLGIISAMSPRFLPSPFPAVLSCRAQDGKLTLSLGAGSAPLLSYEKRPTP